MAEPTADEMHSEIERRIRSSLCTGCRRARKPIEMWCWACLLAALRTAAAR